MITKEEVIKIARLAHLDLSDTDIEKYQKDLSGMLDYAEQLKEVDTKWVEPLYQVTGLENVTREDEVNQQSDEIMTKIVSWSKNAENWQYIVKDVL